MRRLAAFPLTIPSARTWDDVFVRTLPAKYRSVITGHRLHRLAGILSAESFDEMYTSLISHWQRPGDVLTRGDTASTCEQTGCLPEAGQSCLNRMRYADLSRYLPDDLLVKVDRASMANSLESRAPFLDHRVVEFAFGLPHRFLIREGQGKWIVKQFLYRLVPQKLVDRPKTGLVYRSPSGCAVLCVTGRRTCLTSQNWSQEDFLIPRRSDASGESISVRRTTVVICYGMY